MQKVGLFLILSYMVHVQTALAEPVTYRIHKGVSTVEQIEPVVRLAVEVYKAYPDLYERTFPHDERVQAFTGTFSSDPDAIVLTAHIGETLAGAVVATALQRYYVPGDAEQEAFSRIQEPIEDCIYVYGFFVDQAFRGKGIGSELVRNLEAALVSGTHYTHMYFDVTHVDDEHPLKPADFRPAAYFWQKHGYKFTGWTNRMSWPTRQLDGSVCMQEHTTYVWSKRLSD